MARNLPPRRPFVTRPLRRPALGVQQNRVVTIMGEADYTGSTLTSSVFALTANGSATTTLEATVTRNAELASGETVSYSVSRTSVSASLSSVSGSAAIANDGVEVATCYVTVLDANGTPLPGIPAASCVMAVTGTGNTLTQPTGFTDENGRIAGTFVSTVSATKVVSWTIAGQAITATQSVTVGSGVITPDLTIDWSGVTNEATFNALSYISRENPYYTGYSATTGAEVRTDGGPGGTTNYVRCHHPLGSDGNSSTGFRINLPSSQTEFWAEFWVELSTNFDTAGTGANNADYKFVFVALQPSDGRNELKIGNYGNMKYLDSRYNAGPDTLRITTTDTIPTRAFRVRYHNKVTGGSGCISSVEFWDGVNSPQVLEQTGFTLSYTSMTYIKCGANRNKPSLTAQYVDWGLIKLYLGTGNGDPGWGF